MSEQAVLYLRIPAELRRDLEAWAEAEYLQLNPHVIRVLRKAVADWKRQVGPPLRRCAEDRADYAP